MPADRLHHRDEVLEAGHEHVLRVDADQVADRLAEQLRAAEVEGGVDLVGAVAGDVDPRVAGYADDARGVGLGVDRRPAGARRRGCGSCPRPAGRRSRRPGSRSRRGPMAVACGAGRPSPASISVDFTAESGTVRARPRRARAPSVDQPGGPRGSGASSACSLRHVVPEDPPRPSALRVRNSRPRHRHRASWRRRWCGTQARPGRSRRPACPFGASTSRLDLALAAWSTPSMWAPSSRSVISVLLLERVGLGLGGERRERVGEVAARVVDADEAAVEPRVDGLADLGRGCLRVLLERPSAGLWTSRRPCRCTTVAIGAVRRRRCAPGAGSRPRAGCGRVAAAAAAGRERQCDERGQRQTAREVRRGTRAWTAAGAGGGEASLVPFRSVRGVRRGWPRGALTTTVHADRVHHAPASHRTSVFACVGD